MPPSAKSNADAYYATGDDTFLQSRAALEMRTRSFTLPHGGAVGTGFPRAVRPRMFLPLYLSLTSHVYTPL